MAQDFTHRLRTLMQAVGFSSFKALSLSAGVSEKQILRLRRGEFAGLRVETLLKLSYALQVPVTVLIGEAEGAREAEGRRQKAEGRSQESGVRSQESGVKTQNSKLKTQNSKLSSNAVQSVTQNSAPSPELSDLQQEYDRLQQQLMQQRQELLLEFRQASVQILESLLLQLPTAAYAAQQNPQAPAVKLLPLLRPIDRLLEEWGIEAIAAVGAEVPYDPQQHQLMTGTAQQGDQVKVRYTGYRQGDRLLYRAKVSPIG